MTNDLTVLFVGPLLILAMAAILIHLANSK